MNYDQQIVELIPWIRTVAKRYYKDENNSADLASETILKLLLNKDKYNRQKDLKPWCIAVMQNTFLTWSARTSLIQFVGLENAEKSTIVSIIEFNEILAVVKKNIGSLNVRCVCLYAAGYSYEEISNRLNIKLGTVRSRIFNGRKILRNELSKNVSKS